jgi:Helix-turn-helix domain
MSAPDKKNPGKRANASRDGSKPSQPQLMHHNSTAAQCARLLARLRKGPITTFEAMRKLDVYHCPARVLQLRKRGHHIDTVWTRVVTEANVAHRVGQYILVKEAV